MSDKDNQKSHESIIITYEDFRKEIVDTTNQYIDKLPAIFICEYFDKLSREFRGLAQQQLMAEMNTESEVNKDAGCNKGN